MKSQFDINFTSRKTQLNIRMYRACITSYTLNEEFQIFRTVGKC